MCVIFDNKYQNLNAYLVKCENNKLKNWRDFKQFHAGSGGTKKYIANRKTPVQKTIFLAYDDLINMLDLVNFIGPKFGAIEKKLTRIMASITSHYF